MKLIVITFIILLTIDGNLFGQNKTLIGIVPFQNSSESTSYGRTASKLGPYTVAIQDAVADAFLKTKRFSLVEREKMDQLKSEKNLQKSEDFIDGSVIEQSKALGAQFVVLGSISKANETTKDTKVYLVNTTSHSAEIAFNMRVVEVATGEIMASNSFTAAGKGKNAFEDALGEIKPQIETFIKDNFKITASLASVEEKNSGGEAIKVLISGGSSQGVAEKNTFKVYEVTQLEVDGKKLTRKKTIGKLVVLKVEDENFSMCTVQEGGADIAKKMEAGAKIKCELISE